MKRENNKKFKKRRRNQKRSLTCRVLSMMFAIVLFSSTVLINTDYVSQASSFDDMVDMVEVEEDSAAVDTSEDTGDNLDTDVNFESEEGSAETYSESDDFGSSDADFSSGENMFTDGTSESSAPAEEAAQPVSCIVKLKNETIEIKAEAPAGVLPNGTQMTVKAVENNTEDAELTDQYNKLAAKITEQLQSQGKNLDGFLAYNVSFTDADGNPIEPSDKVTYSFTYKEASSPELTDPAASTVTAAMIRTNKETSELELTELKAEEDKLTVETNESKQLTKAAFQSAATAAYTFVWSSTPAADDNENNENKEENGEVNNEEVNTDTNTENTEENGEETNTENNVENSEEEQNQEEAPDQEQIKMIRITADEVNLRVAPSTEADVIATVDTDTQLPLLETVTDEDEFTWYKVSYEEAQAYVRSDMAEVVETEEQGTENEDANEEAEVQVEDEVTYFKTIGNVVVTATAAKGVLPDDAQFVVTPIESDNAQYEDIAARLEEKAENEEYFIAGFLAYDIYFLNNAGEKINPEDGKVKISMEYKNAAAPEEVKESDAVQMDAEEEETSQENTEAKELSVSVMHFVEENGEVTSVVDMTKENSAAVETNEAGEVQKAEFETESFSTFTITWTQMKKSENGEISINVRYVDDKGVDISEKVTNPIGIKASKGTAIKLEDYEPYISGYGFVKAQIGGATYNEDAATLEYIKATFGNTPNDSKVYEYSNDAQTWTTYNTEPTIYLVYTATGLSIKDELESTGDLVPELNDNLKNTITDKTVKYTWYKSINDGEFTEVNRIKVTGETYNIENKNGLDCLNVAMDEGTLSDTQTSVKYKVGLKIDDQEEIYSGEYNVRYYGELHNGGFETPVISESAGSNWQFSNENYKAQGGVWQTTGTADNTEDYYKYQDPDGADIEIVTAKADLKGYDWNGTSCDARGVANTGQFAELNCQAAGALYQDVITYKGENLNFWLSHRARGVHKDSDPEYDTMYVVIMPTSAAKNYSTQESLVTLINNYRDSNEGPVGIEYTKKGKKIICDDNNNNEGIFIERVTSDDQSWNFIKEEGQYLAKSSMTRFFFVAGATASGTNTQGNFLDEVNFGQKLPPADSGKFTLKIEKKFNGGFEPTSDLEEKMTFTIHALHQDGTEIAKSENVPLNGETFNLTDMKQKDGSYSKIFKNVDIGANTKYIYSVEETNAEVSAYDLATTQTVSGGTVQSNKTSTLIGEKDSATFTITNKYTKINLSSIMTYKKTAKVKDWDQRTYDITIDAASTSSSTTSSTITPTADIMLVLDVSASMDEELSNESHYEYESKGKNTKRNRSKLNWWTTYYVLQPDGSYKEMSYSLFNGEWYIGDTKASELSESLEIYERSTVTTSISRLDALKDAVKQFITNTAEKSPNSNIGITAFSSEHKTSQCNGLTKELSNANNNEKDLKDFVDTLNAGGGTEPAIGLNKAKDILDKAKETNPTNDKYVILFTDGAPTGNNPSGDGWNATTKTNAEEAAKKLKKAGYTVYTVGFGLDGNTQKFLAGDDADTTNYPGIASPGCAKNANDAAELNKIFQDINSSITNNLDIVGATITDVIDPRFEIVDAAGGNVSWDENGRQQVTWTDQTIYNPNKEGNPKSWNKTITVRAKDAFIGGNDIPTNVYPDSKISLGEYESAILPKPKVNVKSNLVVNNKEVTIFYGDQIPTDEAVVNELFNKAEPKGYVTQLDGTTKLVTYTIGSDGQPVNPNDFTLKWYSDQACTEEIANLASVNPSVNSPQYYYLKVTYNALRNATNQSNENTTKDGKIYISGDPGVATGSITAHNSETDQSRLYGVYTVNVISGQIQITKKLVKNKNNDPFEVTENDGQTFTFKVTKLQDESGTIKNDEAVDTTFGTNGSKEVTVTIPKGKSQVSLTNSTELQNLPRGIYEVEEVNVPSFELTNAEAATETNCYSTLESLKVRFSLGYRKSDGTNVINNNYEHIGGGQLGVAVYTNKLVTADLKLKKVDADDMNTLLRGAEFELKMWTASENSWMSVEGRDKFKVNEEENLTALLPGRYKLTETKAPNNHALLGTSIYFKVESGKVLLTDEYGVVLKNEDDTPVNKGPSEMWTLAKDDKGGQVLTIKNTEIYSLPSSGGPGIYGFTISGVAFITAALLLFINNKRKEDNIAG